ncbi:MAG: hypothetical protein HOV87_12150 [Catenulispora sp.]|nr:hypothetical protein [Catenulispora sp.]
MLECTCCHAWTVEQVTLARLSARPRTLLRIRHHGYVDAEFDRLADAEAYLTKRGVLEFLVDVPGRRPPLVFDPAVRRSVG